MGEEGGRGVAAGVWRGATDWKGNREERRLGCRVSLGGTAERGDGWIWGFGGGKRERQQE